MRIPKLACIVLLGTAASPFLACGTGEAQEALEWAEARALDRAVPLLQASTPIDDPLVP